jgi:hypothetical protein
MVSALTLTCFCNRQLVPNPDPNPAAAGPSAKSEVVIRGVGVDVASDHMEVEAPAYMEDEIVEKGDDCHEVCGRVNYQ